MTCYVSCQHLTDFCFVFIVCFPRKCVSIDFCHSKLSSRKVTVAALYEPTARSVHDN